LEVYDGSGQRARKSQPRRSGSGVRDSGLGIWNTGYGTRGSGFGALARHSPLLLALATSPRTGH
jgi:hypothetical protein